MHGGGTSFVTRRDEGRALWYAPLWGMLGEGSVLVLAGMEAARTTDTTEKDRRGRGGGMIERGPIHYPSRPAEVDLFH